MKFHIRNVAIAQRVLKLYPSLFANVSRLDWKL